MYGADKQEDVRGAGSASSAGEPSCLVQALPYLLSFPYSSPPFPYTFLLLLSPLPTLPRSRSGWGWGVRQAGAAPAGQAGGAPSLSRLRDLSADPPERN